MKIIISRSGAQIAGCIISNVNKIKKLTNHASFLVRFRVDGYQTIQTDPEKIYWRSSLNSEYFGPPRGSAGPRPTPELYPPGAKDLEMDGDISDGQ